MKYSKLERETRIINLVLYSKLEPEINLDTQERINKALLEMVNNVAATVGLIEHTTDKKINIIKEMLIFIFDGITNYEILFIAHLLNSDASKEIITIAYKSNLIKGKIGFTYKPSKLVKDVLIEDVEGLIIPGGWYRETKPKLI